MMLRYLSSLALIAFPALALACSASSPSDADSGDSGGDLSTGTDGVPADSTGDTGGTTTGATTDTTETGSTTGGATTSASTTGSTAGTTGMTCPDPPAGVKAAPCGYYVKGNKVYGLDGTVHLFHGVARPSTEWSVTGEHLDEPDAKLIKSWNANVVRFPMNQQLWLDPAYSTVYKRTIDEAIRVYHAQGLDIILDLHWNVIPPDGSNQNGQRQGPDANSTPFWQDVANTYKDRGWILFELYNEPHDIPDQTWHDEMYGLYKTVRATGANNIVIIGGLDWAYDLTVAQRVPIVGSDVFNVMYASHPYQDKQDLVGKVDIIGGQYPIIFTEFGDRSGSCSTTASTNVISHADQKGYSWTAWGWYTSPTTDECKFPSLISDWTTGAPTAEGMVAKNALAKYQ